MRTPDLVGDIAISGCVYLTTCLKISSAAIVDLTFAYFTPIQEK